jgi:WD40 repeat protein
MSTETGHSDSDYKYWAFISYSHADDKWAEWLHKSLETYGVPKVLVGKPSKLGPVPKRAYPVFRDRDELPSSADLGEKLTASLRGSRFLIVVCSPSAVKSKWVAEEIKTFKSLGREERVLCLIVDGEPYASDHPEWNLEECFPEPVRYRVDAKARITGERTEPIAADARKGKDGRENAKLKLLAGMFGVNFSDLKQRDQERKHRQMQMIMAGVGVLFVVFSILMVQLFVEKTRADSALGEAQDQRAEALRQKGEAIKAQKDAEKARDAAKKSEKDALDARDAATAAKELEAKARAAEQTQREAAQLAAKQEAKAKEDALKAKKDAEDAADRAEKARKFAEQQEQIAKEQTQKAIDAGKRALSALSVGDFNEATKLIQDGNPATALAYLSRSLANNPNNTSAQARLLSMLEENNWALPLTAPLAHGAPVSMVEFNRPGTRLLTVAGNAAQLWDPATGKPVGQPLAHRGTVRAASFSPDGQRVVTASDDGTARVWNATSGQAAGQPLAHKDWVYSARFSADSKRIITGTRDKKLTVFEADTGRQIAEPSVLENAVEGVWFSPDGGTALALVENNAKLWNLANNAQAASLAHKGRVVDADFSPDGKFIVTASLDGTAQLWLAATGTATNAPLAHTDQVFSAKFSPDGTRVVTASKDRTARIWDVATGKPVGQPMPHGLPVNSAVFSPNGRWVATASEDRSARIWDAATGQPRFQPLKLDGVARMAAFSPDGSRIAVASAANSAQVWTALSGRPLSLPVSHEQYVNWIAFSPDGKLFATVAEDRTARVWSTANGKPVTDPLPHNSRVTYVEFSPDGKYIVTASEDRSARVWDTASGKQIGQQMDHGSWVNMARFSADGRYLVTASQSFDARVWEATTGKPVTPPLKPGGNVRAASFSADGKYVVVSSTDGNAKLYDARTGAAPHAGFAHKQDVRHVAFSRDGKYVATASEDRTARVWEALTGKPVTEPLRHDGAVNWVDFSPPDLKGNILLISASDDRTVRVWDAVTGRPKAEPLVHDAAVRTAMFSPDGQLAVTAPRDKAARVYETSGWKPVTQPLAHGAPIRAAVFSPDGSFVGTASEDRTARVWMLSLPGTAPAWLGQLAEAVGGFQLGEGGGTELVSQPWERLNAIRTEIAKGGESDAFAKWGKWFLADRATRTIAYYSSTPITAFVNDLVVQGGTNALNEVLNVRPAHALALAKLALLAGEGASDQSDFYSRLAAGYEPENPEVLWRRAGVLVKRNQVNDGVALMEQALKLDPRNFAGFGPDGAEINSANRGGTVSKGWLPKGWIDANADKAANVTYQKLSDPPAGGGAALRISVKSASRLQADLLGPRVAARAGRKIVVEGSVRSEAASDLTVVARAVVEPYDELGKQFIRTSREWKTFKIAIDARRDTGAEVVLQVATDGLVDVADVRVRVE